MAISESNLPTAWDPFSIMDRLDDELIVKELQGQTIETLVYQFKQDGKTVTGLSKAGVDATARQMATQGEVLREIELNVLDNGTEYIAHVKAGRFMVQVNQQTGDVKEILLDTVFGVKRQAKFFDNGSENKFAYEQAVSKAARNAKMRLLREDLKQMIIKTAIQQGQVKNINANNRQSGTVSSAATNGKAMSGTSTVAQQKKIHVEAQQKGYDIAALLRTKFNIDSGSTKDLTKQQASELIDWLLKAPGNPEDDLKPEASTEENIPPLPDEPPPF